MAFLDLGQYKPRNGYRPGMAARHMHARVHGFSVNSAVMDRLHRIGLRLGIDYARRHCGSGEIGADQMTNKNPKRSCLDGDPDFDCLKICVAALGKSTSKQMLRANLNYLWERFIGTEPIEIDFNQLKKELGEKMTLPELGNFAAGDAQLDRQESERLPVRDLVT